MPRNLWMINTKRRNIRVRISIGRVFYMIHNPEPDVQKTNTHEEELRGQPDVKMMKKIFFWLVIRQIRKKRLKIKIITLVRVTCR
jgi:hypothetical protein